MSERLHLSGVVHIHPHGHLARQVVSQTVRTTDRCRSRDQPQLEAMRHDLVGEAIPQTFGRVSLEQSWMRRLGDGITVRLRYVLDVRRHETDEPRPNGFAPLRLLAAPEAPPGRGVLGSR